jgi:hypothetical protein
VKTSPLSDAAKENTESKDGRFLVIADGHKSLLPTDTNVTKLSLKSFLNDFQKPIQKEWNQTSWLETSTAMIM